ncbi:MAG: RelA/spoT family protein [Erysipelotrichaceae bacterium]
MRLKVFDTIDQTLALLEKNEDYYHEVKHNLKKYFDTIFLKDQERIVDINSRVKTSDSLREKIIRNRFYMESECAQTILDHLSDLIGFTIQTRFIEEEYAILKELRDFLTIENSEDHYFYNPDFPNIFLDSSSHQPQIQKNGFAIYRIDGYYQDERGRVNFELQIKALVHSFWGEIEHKLVYKNTNYYVYDDFMKDILGSIKANLEILDRQLSIVYNQMQNRSKKDSGLSESSFEKLITKAINDLFLMKMNQSIGFTLNIKNTSAILGHYIFIKDIRYEGDSNDRVSKLFKTFKKLNSVQIDFENEIALENKFNSNDIFVDILGKYLISIINTDYDWFVFFKMLFAIEPGNNIEDFSLFLTIIKNYLVDNYWLNTSFVKLSMEDGEKIHIACAKILADSLVEIGTIGIIHDDKMIKINKAFVLFVTELEQRVINYDDFIRYQSAYYQDWCQRLHLIFEK